MSDDLVKRLRFCAHMHPQFGYPENGKLFAESAARIEALEAALLAADELARAALECHPYVEELRCGDDMRAALAAYRSAADGK